MLISYEIRTVPGKVRHAIQPPIHFIEKENETYQIHVFIVKTDLQQFGRYQQSEGA